MIQYINESAQYHDKVLSGAMRGNKPVFGRGTNEVYPYSCLFYWSHGRTTAEAGFPLHPHQGFEILSFLWEGAISHFDTATQVWTPLYAGDFQVIQSNSGVSHQEKVAAGSRMFQIWLDPDYRQALKESPSYQDYSAADLVSEKHLGYGVTHYVGGGSPAQLRTPRVTIRTYQFDGSPVTLKLESSSTYSFYVLEGEGSIAGYAVNPDDFVKVAGESSLEMDIKGRLFCIQSPTELSYTPLSQKPLFR